MAGQPSFFEVGVLDARRAQAFFGELFGWSFEPVGETGNALTETPFPKGGFHGDDPDCGLELYFSVDDIEAAVARVRELGGEAGEPGAGDERFGRFTRCRDDQGVRFGLHQPPAR